MSSMISQTLQGAALSATSNILAQIISSYKDNTQFSLSIPPIIKFIIFSIISNPPNIIWQTLLEDNFPTNVPVTAPDSDIKRAAAVKMEKSKTNVLIKFFLDQTVGAVVNTLMFLSFMGYVNAPQTKLSAWDTVAQECKDKLWPMMLDGYKFWPAVSLISFVWVPVDKRVVFGCSVGILWGIYLSLMVGA